MFITPATSCNLSIFRGRCVKSINHKIIPRLCITNCRSHSFWTVSFIDFQIPKVIFNIPVVVVLWSNDGKKRCEEMCGVSNVLFDVLRKWKLVLKSCCKTSVERRRQDFTGLERSWERIPIPPPLESVMFTRSSKAAESNFVRMIPWHYTQLSSNNEDLFKCENLSYYTWNEKWSTPKKVNKGSAILFITVFFHPFRH